MGTGPGVWSACCNCKACKLSEDIVSNKCKRKCDSWDSRFHCAKSLGTKEELSIKGRRCHPFSSVDNDRSGYDHKHNGFRRWPDWNASTALEHDGTCWISHDDENHFQFLE